MYCCCIYCCALCVLCCCKLKTSVAPIVGRIHQRLHVIISCISAFGTMMGPAHAIQLGHMNGCVNIDYTSPKLSETTATTSTGLSEIS